MICGIFHGGPLPQGRAQGTREEETEDPASKGQLASQLVLDLVQGV